MSIVSGLIGAGVGFAGGFAVATILPTSLPTDVQIQMNRLSLLDTMSGLEMSFMTVFHHLQIGDWDEWVVGFGYAVGEAQVIVRVGRNNLTGEISVGIAKFGSNQLEVYLDGAVVGTLEQYTAVGTPFAGWIGISLVPPA